MKYLIVLQAQSSTQA